jgi:hypothetical protein
LIEERDGLAPERLAVHFQMQQVGAPLSCRRRTFGITVAPDERPLDGEDRAALGERGRVASMRGVGGEDLPVALVPGEGLELDQPVADIRRTGEVGRQVVADDAAAAVPDDRRLVLDIGAEGLDPGRWYNAGRAYAWRSPISSARNLDLLQRPVSRERFGPGRSVG